MTDEVDPVDAAGPLQIVVMGVAGTGKSTIGALVAADLGVELIEGDAYHPQSNIDKMSSGQPLTDADRLPWLETLAGLLAAEGADGRARVLACSALRRRYRDVLRGDRDTPLFFVHLHADYEVLEQRMKARQHFMPASLLKSQFETLEPLEEDEKGVVVDVALPVDEVMNQIRESLRERCRPAPGK